MRFLIREQDFETPLAAGRFQYEQNNTTTGAYESWRLTEIADGYRFLRVDMDTRETGHDSSILYHLLLDPDGRPERLKLRRLVMGDEMQADITFEINSVMVTGAAGGDRFEHESPLKGDYSFYFPTATGLAVLLRDAPKQGEITAVNFDHESSPLLAQKSAKIIAQQEEEYEVGRQKIVVRPYLIRWSNRENKLWLDEYCWPVKIDFGDGQIAKETQYIRYK